MSQYVAGAVQAAGNALASFADWVVGHISSIAKALFDPVAAVVLNAIQDWISGLVGLFEKKFRANSPIRVIGDYLSVFEAIWSYMLVPLAIIGALITVANAIEVIIQVLSAGISSVLARVVQYAVPMFLFGAGAAAIGAVVLAFENGLSWVFIDQLGETTGFITGFADTQAGYFWLLETMLLNSIVNSAAAFALLSIFIALVDMVYVWWVNLLLVAGALVLAIIAVRDYLSVPDEIMKKYISPFVSTIIGVLAYSSIVTVGLAITQGVLSGALLP